jgi:CRP-like cAMP-binding protein
VRARIFTALKRAGIPLAVPATTNFVERHDREHDEAHEARLYASYLAGLRSVHLFKSLTEQELDTLAEGMTTVVYTKGETITRQGAVAHYLYVLVHGSVEVRTRKDGDITSEQRVVATLDAPEFYGEMGLMTGAPRGADVVARTDVECYRLGKSALERVLAARPEIGTSLAEILAARHTGCSGFGKLPTLCALVVIRSRARRSPQHHWAFGCDTEHREAAKRLADRDRADETRVAPFLRR